MKTKGIAKGIAIGVLIAAIGGAGYIVYKKINDIKNDPLNELYEYLKTWI
jgi:hypothetical protein